MPFQRRSSAPISEMRTKIAYLSRICFAVGISVQVEAVLVQAVMEALEMEG